MKKILEPGIYPDISNDEYHNEIEGVSNSYMGNIDECPANGKVDKKETHAMILGRACHSYVLEGPEAFFKEFIVLPEGMSPTTKAGRLVGEENPNKGIISAADSIKIHDMRKAVLSHPLAAKLIKEGVSEQTVIWKDESTGLLCKCRPDRIPAGDKGTVVDLKTADNAGYYPFSRSVLKYGYARQDAFYSDGVEAVTRKTFDSFAFIVVEKNPPYRTEVYILDDEWRTWGRQEYIRLLQIEKECRDKGFYPHYQNAGADELYKPSYL